MSTTVSYKGATIATVSNQTKTLLTEGKYLEDDITLEDVSGGGATLITKNISANGTYNASSDSADGYSQVNVAVPASAVDSGTKSISTNGTHDVVGYASANVNVPNSYSASDEGKVVSNGALVAQTAHADVTPTTSDQTIDTTTNNSLKVKGDADLVASNIKKDVEIFGVTGSYEGGGGTDYLAQCLANTLTEYINNDISYVKSYGFYNCTALRTVELNNLNFLETYTFQYCSNLESVSFDKVYELRNNCLHGIKASVIVLPSFKYSNTGTMRDNTALTAVDLGKASQSAGDMYIGQSVFQNDSALNKVILRSAKKYALQNINSFNGTPFASGGTGGTLYVPSALISDYQAATNWSTILGYANNSIQAIEGSIYETQYADGTPIST